MNHWLKRLLVAIALWSATLALVAALIVASALSEPGTWAGHADLVVISQSRDPVPTWVTYASGVLGPPFAFTAVWWVLTRRRRRRAA